MKINNLSFITPLTNQTKIVLEKNYSQNLYLSDGTTINISSNVGPREKQEDCIAVTENNNYILLLVADGMGGLVKGEEASYHIARLIKKWIDLQQKTHLDNMNETNLEKNITKIISYIKDNLLSMHSGTTLNMSIIGPENTFIINIGDSRTYSIKNNEIKLITRDDSLAFLRLPYDSTENRDQIRFYGKNNVITNNISIDSLPSVVVSTIKNEEYDILCHMTDGVSDILSEEQIKNNLLKDNPAFSLVKASVTSDVIYNPNPMPGFNDCICPHDNAAAVVYSKIKKK